MPGGPTVLSLFTGAGGLDLGLEAAGFETRLCIENDTDALATMAINRPSWAVARLNDAADFARNPKAGLRSVGLRSKDVVLLAGGPPCQPFSKAGNWTERGPKRMRDPRASKTINAYLNIVNELRPEVLLFENVPGFAFRGRSEGYQSLVRGLITINAGKGTRYTPQLLKINAADYGAPQLRERIFIVAHRAGRTLDFPQPTHGPVSASGAPYRTAWDAIGDLDRPLVGHELSGRWGRLLPSIPEGRNYLWHTPGQGGRPLFGWRTRYWSFLLKLAKSQPAWTIPASPGPAAGPFHWRSRLLSIRELCRLQTFPDDYKIIGNRRAAQRQIGNAVPPALAELVGLEIRRQLLHDKSAPARPSLTVNHRRPCPEPEPVLRVPRHYLCLAGNHKPHPGPGKGPARVTS